MEPNSGLAQALAKKAGLSQVWVGRIEAGGGYGSRETRRKLAAALETPVGIGGEE